MVICQSENRLVQTTIRKGTKFMGKEEREGVENSKVDYHESKRTKEMLSFASIALEQDPTVAAFKRLTEYNSNANELIQPLIDELKGVEIVARYIRVREAFEKAVAAHHNNGYQD